MCYIASVKHNRLHFQVHCVSKYSVRLDRRLVGTTRTLVVIRQVAVWLQILSMLLPQ